MIRSSSVVERSAVNRLAVGSSPTAGANYVFVQCGDIAQLGEHRVRNAEVGGSSPPISTISSEYSWWGRGDSNSHALRAHDPKSCASAIPPLPQITYSNLILGSMRFPLF